MIGQQIASLGAHIFGWSILAAALACVASLCVYFRSRADWIALIVVTVSHWAYKLALLSAAVGGVVWAIGAAVARAST